RPKFSHAGPVNVNRAAELKTLPGVGCSALGISSLRCRPIRTFGPRKFRMCRHIGRQKMKLLHLRSPGNHLRPFEHHGVVESADLDEHSPRRAIRACREVDSASLAEMSSRRPRAILLIEGSRRALGELEALCFNRHVEIACAARNRLARPAVA